MNISPISFGQNSSRFELTIPVTNAPKKNQSAQNGDTFQNSKQAKKHKNSPVKEVRNRVLVTALIAALASATNHAIATTPKTAEIQYTPDINIEELAEDYNVNADFLAQLNNLDVECSEYPESIKVPENYDISDKKIENVRKKLYKCEYGSQEYENTLCELQGLLENQYHQQEVAETYKDKMYTYFYVKKNINIEEFKKLFSIKDGVLVGNNDLSDCGRVRYISEDIGLDKMSYKDYTHLRLYPGKTVKVPNLFSFTD